MSEVIKELRKLDEERARDELRLRFAIAALQNSAICTGTASEWELRGWFKDRGGITRQEIAARQAFSYADAMLDLVPRR